MQSSALGSASASSRSPTMQPPRDDPGAPTSNGAVEVPHETVLKLRSLTTTIQCLLHTLTGECVTLPTSEQPWQLSFAKGFGYIWSAGGQKPMWCKSLLSHTAWKKGETVCIAHRPAATADAQEHTPHTVWWWLIEWKNEVQPYWVKWRASMDPVVCELPALKVMCSHAPKSDFRCFWDIIRISECCWCEQGRPSGSPTACRGGSPYLPGGLASMMATSMTGSCTTATTAATAPLHTQQAPQHCLHCLYIGQVRVGTASCHRGPCIW